MASTFQKARLFIGGLGEFTTLGTTYFDLLLESLDKYFSTFGSIKDIFLSKGFGFVEYENESCMQKVLALNEHFLDGRQIDPKPALNRQLNRQREKLFVGGIPIDFTNKDMHKFFSKYGPLSDAFVVRDVRTGKSRGYGFVAYLNHEDAVKLLVEKFVIINDLMVEICPAVRFPERNWAHGRQIDGMMRGFPYPYDQFDYGNQDTFYAGFRQDCNYPAFGIADERLNSNSLHLKRPLSMEYNTDMYFDRFQYPPNSFSNHLSVPLASDSVVNQTPFVLIPQRKSKRLKPNLPK